MSRKSNRLKGRLTVLQKSILRMGSVYGQTVNELAAEVRRLKRELERKDALRIVLDRVPDYVRGERWACQVFFDAEMMRCGFHASARDDFASVRFFARQIGRELADKATRAIEAVLSKEPHP